VPIIQFSFLTVNLVVIPLAFMIIIATIDVTSDEKGYTAVNNFEYK